jgi:hypothetical protein
MKPSAPNFEDIDTAFRLSPLDTLGYAMRASRSHHANHVRQTGA